MADLELSSLTRIPKIELHAHLNGCVRLSHLQDLVEDSSTLPSRPGANATPREYFQFMSAVGHVTGSSPHNLRVVLRRVLEDFEADGVVYLELRSSPKHTGSMSKVEYVETILGCMCEYQGEMVVRYLVSVDQSKSLAEMNENADLAIHYAATSPLVVGLDLCGDFYSATKEHSMAVLQRCKNAGLKIACHIAEDPTTLDHTADMLRMIGPHRLGHATLISPDSEDGKFVKENNMLIECCMTSNILCRSVLKYEDHHFKKWYDLGHPVILCTDDSGTFDTSLSKEYQIAVKFFGMSRDDLKKMNFDCIRWIFDDDVKDRLYEIFKN